MKDDNQESAVTKKVEELMVALDQVKKYRALSRLVVDFGIIVLAFVVLLLFLELAVNSYRLMTGFPCYYSPPNQFTCANVFVGSPSSTLQFFAGISVLLVPVVGVLVGIFWVDRNLRSIKGGDWRDSLKEGFPGALKLLQVMDWDTTFDDMRISKIGYTVYFLIKVAGYWLLAFLILFFPYVFGVSLLHTTINLYFLGIISFILVLVLTRHDLGRRYRQVVSLDTIMWELRWFSSEFRRAEFGPAEKLAN